MKRALEEALAECLARMDAGADMEAVLRDQGELAAELRPLLETARDVQRRQIEGHTPEAWQRGRARMHAARRAEAEAPRTWAWLFGRPLALAGVAAVVAVLAAVGFTTDILRFNADSTSAQVEGVVSRVDEGAIVLQTADGQQIVRVGKDTVVLDASGAAIEGSDIAPGRSVRVEVEEDEDGALAHRIEVEDDETEGRGAEVEFSGVAESVGGGALSVQASFGVATVKMDSSTRVKGTPAVGVSVKVHATLQADGSYLAREIEVQSNAGSGEPADADSSGPSGDESGGSDSSGPGSGPEEPSDSNSPGSGDDSTKPVDEKEHDSLPTDDPEHD